MKAQCCGECAWWKRRLDDKRIGLCSFPLPPFVNPMPLTFESEHQDCPCFKRKAKRNEIVTHNGPSFAGQLSRAKKRYPKMWNKKGGGK